MKAYRIGKIEGPWTNIEPPIRSKVVPVATPKDLESVEAQLTQNITQNVTQDIEKLSLHTGECTRRPCCKSPINEKEQCDLKTRSYENVTREQYITELEQKAIANGIGSFPSLDPKTQNDITLEYRAMHERVKDMGLYTCRYSEYGKEAIRYGILFAAFIYLLQAKWYLTSACFLGMFWVRLYARFLIQQSANLTYSNK